jgi:hypothetical protein
MRPSEGSSDTTESTKAMVRLDLPLDPEFRPDPPTVSMGILMARNADLRRWFPNGIPTAAERLASKCDVVFRLL